MTRNASLTHSGFRRQSWPATEHLSDVFNTESNHLLYNCCGDDWMARANTHGTLTPSCISIAKQEHAHEHGIVYTISLQEAAAGKM